MTEDRIIRDEPTSDKLILGDGLSIGMASEPSGRKFAGISIIVSTDLIRQLAVSSEIEGEDYINFGYSLDTEHDLEAVIKRLQEYKEDVTPIS